MSLKDTFLLFSISKMGHKSELTRDTAATQLIQRMRREEEEEGRMERKKDARGKTNYV